MITLENAIERGIIDILTFYLGQRPLIKSEDCLFEMVLNRFKRVP